MWESRMPQPDVPCPLEALGDQFNKVENDLLNLHFSMDFIEIGICLLNPK